MIDRRSFLKGGIAAPFLSSVTLAQDRVNPIGLQIYTVRAELRRDFEGTLAKVAAVGYKEVELAFVGEFAGGYGRSAQQVRTALRNSGLSGVSAHVPFDSLGDRWSEIC